MKAPNDSNNNETTMNYSEYLHHFLESPVTWIVLLVAIIAILAIDIKKEAER